MSITTYSTEHGTIYVSSGCVDAWENFRVYDQPPEGGSPITLQGPAMKAFKQAENAFAKKTWRPGIPPKFTRKDGETRFRPIYLTGSVRSCSLAWLLYNRDPDRYAHPNSGYHMEGLAIDVHTYWLGKFPVIRTILLNHGWRQSRPVDEPWHFTYHVLG